MRIPCRHHLGWDGIGASDAGFWVQSFTGTLVFGYVCTTYQIQIGKPTLHGNAEHICPPKQTVQARTSIEKIDHVG